MSRLGINTGSNPNDGQGDPLRIAMGKINSNFTEIYNTFGDGFDIVSYASTAGISTVAQNLTGSPRINVSGILNTGITTTEHIEVRNITSTGVITATQFVGDGSQLENVVATNTGVEVLDENVRKGVAKELNFGEGLFCSGPDGVGRVTIAITTSIVSGGGTAAATPLEFRNQNIILGEYSKVNFGSNLLANVNPLSGIVTVSIPQTGINIPGVSTFNGVVVGGSNTSLVVNGNARITGILTIGTSSLTLDGNNNQIKIGTGVTIKETGGASFSEGIKIVGVVTATSFNGSGSQLTGVITSLTGYATSSYVDSQIATITSTIGVASTITSTQVSNWDTSYSWGNHVIVGYATQGYVTNALVGYATQGYVANSLVGYATQGYVTNSLIGYATQGYVADSLVSYATQGYVTNALVGYATQGYVTTQIGLNTFTGAATSITAGQISNWNTSYSWGNHAAAGYATTSYVSNASVAFASTSGIATIAQGLTGTPNITVSNILATDASFSGNVTIGGTLSYVSLTNQDSVGIITARSGILIGNPISLGATLSPSGNATFAGIVTAISFTGGFVGNVTGNATGLSGTPNITVGTIGATSLNASGVVTATTFSGALTGDVTGTATTATNLSNAANITTGTINSSRLSGTYGINVSFASTSGIATVATGLTGSPDITVGKIIAGVTSSIIPFLWSTYASLPPYSTYHGAVAHAHDTGKLYYAHTRWVELVNTESDGTVGTGTENYKIGVITATSFIGNGSQLTGVITSLVGYATQGYVTNSLVGYATQGYVTNALVGYATQGYVTNSLVGYATQGYVTNALVGYATQGYVTTQIGLNTFTGAATSITAGQISNWNTSYSWGNHATVGYLTNVNITAGSNITVLETSEGNFIITSTSIAGAGGTWAVNSAGIHTSKNVGIGTTLSSSALTVEGDGRFSGVVTATRFQSTSAGTPTIGAATTISLETITVAISTDATVGRKLTVAGLTTVSSSGLNVTGIVTASSFSGSASGLTGIPAGQLTGALPALDGSALTGILASGTGIVIREEGTPIGTAGTINFVGAGVTATFSSGIATVSITATGGSIAGINTSGTSTFNNLSVTGVSTLGNTIVGTGKSVGIGTTLPTNTLTVVGSGTSTSQLFVTGVSTLGNTIVGGATTQLIVNGNTRITGILTIGTGSITLDGSSNQLKVGTGVTISSSGATVAGVVTATTFSGALTGNVTGNVTGNATGLSGTPNITVGTIGATSLNASGVVTATSFVGDGSALTGIVASGTGIVIREEGTTIGTAGTINFVGAGVTATFSSGIATISITASGGNIAGIDTSGTSTFNNLNATGIVTATSGFSGNLTGNVTGNATGLSGTPNITVGTIGATSLNASGVVTATKFESASAGTPTIGAATTISLETITVAISTDATVGRKLTVAGLTTASSGGLNVTGVVTATSFVGNGSQLTGITASGSSVIIRDSGTLVGTAGTIDFGDNLTVSAVSAGVVTVTASGGGTVNNGTLTLAVSGTGLSGSQTFTANQSSNATFTVTSNATSSNTASTLVARDGSGDFTAGTINATSFRTNTTTGNGTDVGFAIKYYITSSGASAYRFAGPGLVNSTNNPTLYLHRGFTYIFENSTGSSHPFAIRYSSGGTGYGSTYLSGSQSGTQIFTVPFDAPNTLVYQCTIHGGMVGTLNIVT